MASRRGPDNSVRVAVSGLINGTPWANIFWVQLSTSSTISQSDLDAWVASFLAAYATNFMASAPTGTSATAAKATLFLPGGSVLESTTTSTTNGSGGAAVEYDGACRVVSWLSTVYWRGGKPRTYLPGLAGAHTDDGQTINAAGKTAVEGEATAFRTAVNALTQGTITGTVLGFVSFRTANAERIPPVFFTITGRAVHSRIGTQRRRLGPWIT